MARPKPDNYERMQIVLGDKERQLLQDYRFAYMFNQIATPAVSLLKDVSGMAMLYLILSSLFPNWSKGINLTEIDAYGDDDEGILQYLEGLSLAGGALGLGVGAIFGGPFGAVGLAILGALVGEVGDDITRDVYEGKPQQLTGVGFTMLMIKLRGIYQGVKGSL